MDQVVTRRCGNASPSQVMHMPVPDGTGEGKDGVGGERG